MKKQLLRLSLSILTVFGFAVSSNAQCPSITCPGNISVNSDSGICGAVVNYTAPIGTDTCNTISQTFNYTGSMQIYVVPAGVATVTIQADGAQGGSNVIGVVGGLGGTAVGDLAVTPGDTLFVYVGGNNGYNGGGQGGNTLNCANAAGGIGGGASDVRVGGITLNDRVIVGAGGGGAGGDRINGCGRGSGGGGGGGYYGGGGGAGWPSATGGTLPTGGTQSAGGSGGITTSTAGATNGMPGALGIGGDGGDEVGSNQGGSGTALPGGTGGGLTGASGQYNVNWTGQSGAGGSSYIAGLTNSSTTSGTRSGNGQVIISYAGTDSTTQIAGLPSGSLFPGGTTTNTFVVTSGSFSDTCSFTVYVGGGVDTSVTRNLSTFTANETGATYQWLNCDSNFMAISGATNQSYTATTNGSYAVVVSKNGCTDTSACQMINNVGIANVGFGNISIYPNPTNGLFTIDMGSHSEAVNYTVTSVDGRIITQKSNVTDNKITIDLGNESKGVYLLKLHNHKSSSVLRISKL